MVESPALEGFKRRVDTALRDTVQFWDLVGQAGGWTC